MRSYVLGSNRKAALRRARTPSRGYAYAIGRATAAGLPCPIVIGSLFAYRQQMHGRLNGFLGIKYAYGPRYGGETLVEVLAHDAQAITEWAMRCRVATLVAWAGAIGQPNPAPALAGSAVGSLAGVPYMSKAQRAAWRAEQLAKFAALDL